MRFNKSLWLKI